MVILAVTNPVRGICCPASEFSADSPFFEFFVVSESINVRGGWNSKRGSRIVEQSTSISPKHISFSEVEGVFGLAGVSVPEIAESRMDLMNSGGVVQRDLMSNREMS